MITKIGTTKNSSTSRANPRTVKNQQRSKGPM
jgi:hypothetical protein